MDFKKKYFKYKLKYLNLKKQTGGSWYYREYTEKEKIDYANLLPYTKKINYQNYNLTLNIVQPNTMNKRIRNIAYPAKFEGSSPSDGHSHAKEELLRKDENSIGYGVLILLGNDPIYYVTLRVFPQYKFCDLHSSPSKRIISPCAIGSNLPAKLILHFILFSFL